MLTYQEMESLWDENRNGVPFSSSLNHSIRFWWLGSCGHSWESNITNKKLFGCPVCAGKLIQPGVNDFESNYPLLAAEWHPTKNLLKPSEVSRKSSSKKFWWLCSLGHEWESKVLPRANGSGCPTCSNYILLEGFNDLATTHPELVSQWNFNKNSLSPKEVKTGSNIKVWWICAKGHEWESAISNRTGTKKTGCHECSGHKKSLKNSNAEIDFPHLVNQWSPKNGTQLSEHIGNSLEKFYWQCAKGHEWSQSLRARSRSQNLCPVCTGHILVQGVNDLKAVNPNLTEEWHPTKNKDLFPDVVTGTSGRKVWWLGKCGHEWEAKISSRKTGTGCPVCSSKVITDDNSIFSEISKNKFWHPTKNIPLEPTTVFKASNKKIWWQCELNHEWEATPNSLSGCPICANSRVSAEYNSLKKIFPQIAAEWHPTKNGSLLSSAVLPGSKKRIWWLGKCGHEWETPILNRTSGTGCPVCSNNKILPGHNDLATLNPALVTQWHPNKNILLPNQVSSGSRKKVWWVCEKGHEWKSVIHDRNKGIGCPYCVHHVSKAEKMIYDYVKTLFPNAEANTRAVLLDRQELDIFVPEKNIAIEYNGLYWHDENHKPRNYHRNKWLACKEQGIQLIQIWEDDWNRNPEQVKRMLTHKLGVAHENKIYARQTQVVPLTAQQAEAFLEENHVQGFSTGSYYLGLRDRKKLDGGLVAVLVVKKEAGTEGKTLNIIRYATSMTVVGGFTKLLNYGEATYAPDRFITFSDNTVSDGGLYENNGFTADKILKPDYMYVIKGERKHKFGYRLKRFKNDPELLWDENLTEKELAQLNNIPRIWDAGKTRWVKEVK